MSTLDDTVQRLAEALRIVRSCLDGPTADALDLARGTIDNALVFDREAITSSEEQAP